MQKTVPGILTIREDDHLMAHLFAPDTARKRPDTNPDTNPVTWSADLAPGLCPRAFSPKAAPGDRIR